MKKINHNHEHHHHDLRGVKSNHLLFVSLLNFSITLVQIVGGIISNSLSLLSDAIHNLGDSSAIFIAFLASKVSCKKPDDTHTFGYKRIEIIAALFNASVLIAICLFLFYEAYQRFVNPEPIKGMLMLIVAIFGLLANVISVIILNKNRDSNLNIKAAYLHLLGDTMSSVAVIIGGIAIWIWNVVWVDPLITALVSIYIIHHTLDIIRDTVDILMQRVPSEIDVNKIKEEIEKISEVHDIHHLHIWKLDDSVIHLETHVNLKNDMDMKQMMKIKSEIEEVLHNKFDIIHTTLQMEYICTDKNNELIVKDKNIE